MRQKTQVKLTERKRRVLELMHYWLKKDIHLSKYDAGIIISLEDIVSLFQRFIDDDLQFSKDSSEMSYACALPIAEFYMKKTEIAKSIIDVSMLLKVSKPHLKYLHSDVPKLFRETLKNIEIQGKKPAVYQLLSNLIEYQYEIRSAITSGRSSTILETIDMEFLDVLKMYREALKSIDSKHWMAYVILQLIAKHSGGEPMTMQEIANKTGFSLATVREACNELFDKCKEILTVGQIGNDRTISLHPTFAKYELMKQ